MGPASLATEATFSVLGKGLDTTQPTYCLGLERPSLSGFSVSLTIGEVGVVDRDPKELSCCLRSSGFLTGGDVGVLERDVPGDVSHFLRDGRGDTDVGVLTRQLSSVLVLVRNEDVAFSVRKFPHTDSTGVRCIKILSVDDLYFDLRSFEGEVTLGGVLVVRDIPSFFCGTSSTLFTDSSLVSTAAVLPSASFLESEVTSFGLVIADTSLFSFFIASVSSTVVLMSSDSFSVVIFLSFFSAINFSSTVFAADGLVIEIFVSTIESLFSAISGSSGSGVVEQVNLPMIRPIGWFPKLFLRDSLSGDIISFV